MWHMDVLLMLTPVTFLIIPAGVLSASHLQAQTPSLLSAPISGFDCFFIITSGRQLHHTARLSFLQMVFMCHSAFFFFLNQFVLHAVFLRKSQPYLALPQGKWDVHLLSDAELINRSTGCAACFIIWGTQVTGCMSLNGGCAAQVCRGSSWTPRLNLPSLCPL